MTKLVYPGEGLYPRCQSSSEAVKAISRCSFDIPGGFAYAGYLGSLGSTLRGHMNTNKSIANKIKQTDSSYEALSNSLVASANSITPYKLSKRKRMIV